MITLAHGSGYSEGGGGGGFLPPFPSGGGGGVGTLASDPFRPKNSKYRYELVFRKDQNLIIDQLNLLGLEYEIYFKEEWWPEDIGKLRSTSVTYSTVVCLANEEDMNLIRLTIEGCIGANLRLE